MVADRRAGHADARESVLARGGSRRGDHRDHAAGHPQRGALRVANQGIDSAIFVPSGQPGADDVQTFDVYTAGALGRRFAELTNFDQVPPDFAFLPRLASVGVSSSPLRRDHGEVAAVRRFLDDRAIRDDAAGRRQHTLRERDPCRGIAAVAGAPSSQRRDHVRRSSAALSRRVDVHAIELKIRGGEVGPGPDHRVADATDLPGRALTHTHRLGIRVLAGSSWHGS